MRQRFLQGRHTYQQYSRDLGRLDLISDGTSVLSTDFYRTIQSGYAELMGMMYEENKLVRPLISIKQQRNLLHAGRGMPSFRIRRLDSINNTLFRFATPYGFVTIPIYTYIDDSPP